MRGKIKFLTINVLMIFLFMSTITYNLIKTNLVFEINGEEELFIEAKIAYLDEGASAHEYNLFKGKKKMDVSTINAVNVDKIGKYSVKYILDTNNDQIEKTRIVNVVDTTKPIIKVADNEVKSCGENLKKIKYSAHDNYDGDITDKITKKISDNYLVLTVIDSNKNEATKKLKIVEVTSESPKISLNGNEHIYVNQFDDYKELGAVAYDTCDGDLSKNIKIINDVDTSKIGEYKVTYKVEDSYGNVSQVIRNVHVINDETEIDIVVPKGAKIYLTFDDGPGQYTEEILNILDKYDVKATFFVTNQFPKYQHLIKEEYARGHAVGVHTYSHLWKIYSSVDTYMEDFNAINNIIYNQTGTYSKIFRFPGGSSNTISKKHNEGIMTVLSKKMLEDGYQYYDWNVDSTDTAGKNTVESIIKNTTKSFKGNSYYIVLMHDIKQNTLKALPQIIEYGLSIGYEFSAINEDAPVIHSTIRN